MIKVEQIILPVKFNDTHIKNAVAKKLGIKEQQIQKCEILKLSIDARRKPDLKRIATIGVHLNPQIESRFENLKCEKNTRGLDYPKMKPNKKFLVVGFGPSGIFAGLALALAGYKPIILEQGKCVEERQKDIDLFWNERKLNKYSNVQFGEGGAGTFSDGKLASNVSNSYTKKVINEFILNNAPEEIFYSNNPHIGSDKLKEVVTMLRKKIENNGGKVIFNAHFDTFSLENGQISSIKYTDLTTKTQKKLNTNAVILAVGHSAVDVYNLLKENKCNLKQKPFAMGVRIEHSQSELNFSQYGKIDKDLPPANYKIVEHLDNGRSVFSFCMCPGGQVVASSSEEGTIVTNGMSYYKRDGENANSALLVNVLTEDFGSDDALAGVEFQKKYEKLAFELGGANYNAPAEKVKDFLSGVENPNGNFEKIKPSYLPNVTPADLKKCLPEFVYESLKLALPKLNRKLNGISDDENILIGVESRSSSPVQIVRDENFMTNIVGLFACGEGSGYAGGITTSAQDGIKCAEKVMDYLKNN